MNKYLFNFYFKIFLFLLFFITFYFLYEKYPGQGYTISEWLINYQGGFTRRGFLGEIVYQLSNFFLISRRLTILIFQTILYFVYFYLIFNYIKKINKSKLIIFALFSPLFLIYPVAETEVLARKEIFIFISFLLTVNIFSFNISLNNKLIFFSLIIVVCNLIWEGIIFYLSYFITVIIVSNHYKYKKIYFFKILISLIPFFLATYFIITVKLSFDDKLYMCSLLNECFGAMDYLIDEKNTLLNNINDVQINFKKIYLLRYLIIFFIGFFPLILLLKFSKFKIDKNNFLKKINPLVIFFLISLPSFLIYFIAIDWGRWLNISYTLSLITFFFLLKNNFVEIGYNNFKNFNIKNKFYIIIIFIIFSFGWSPKLLISDDVSSIPIYRKVSIIAKNIF